MNDRGSRPLPYSSELHQRAHQFLVEEAHLLDTQQMTAWLGLLCPEVEYLMPVVVTAMRGNGNRSTIDHLREDLYSLTKRAERLMTDHAWTEDPPSRVRHYVTNVRTFAGAGGELEVESAVLLFRSRGDDRAPDLVSAGRSDVLAIGTDGDLRLRRRVVQVDEAVLRTQNLAILL